MLRHARYQVPFATARQNRTIAPRASTNAMNVCSSYRLTDWTTRNIPKSRRWRPARRGKDSRSVNRSSIVPAQEQGDRGFNMGDTSSGIGSPSRRAPGRRFARLFGVTGCAVAPRRLSSSTISRTRCIEFLSLAAKICEYSSMSSSVDRVVVKSSWAIL